MYRLFKLYNNIKQSDKAENVKSELINKYSDSKYALILLNKTVVSAENSTNKEILKTYEGIYQMYLDGNYMAVKQAKLEADKKYSGNAMQAKFDFIYALAVGKTDSIGAFKLELLEIIKAYPKTDVSERAQDILNLINNPTSASAKPEELNKPEFALDTEGANYYVFATKTEKYDMNDLLQKIINYNEEYYQLETLRANTLISNDGYQILYVREFNKLNPAVQYLNGFNTIGFYKNNVPSNVSFIQFVISTDLFKKMLKEKKIEAYNTYFSEQLPTLLK